MAERSVPGRRPGAGGPAEPVANYLDGLSSSNLQTLTNGHPLGTVTWTARGRGRTGRRRMQVGIALPNQVAPGGSLADAVSMSLAATRDARDLGYDAVLAGQHHLSDPYPYCAPIPLLARLAADAGTMDLVAMDL